MRQIILDLGMLNLFGLELSLRVYGYGLMLVLGFLTSIALAHWRARRMGEDPDAITTVGILALVGGVVGARIAYIIQNWDQFRSAASPLGEVLNVTSGGLIYYGGVILATLLVVGFLLIKKLPIRRFLDIVAVSMMVGLAFGRAGCLLNGCCYGAQCDKDWVLSTQFPMYSQPLLKLDDSPGPFSASGQGPSPVYDHQMSHGHVHPDPRLTHLRFSDRPLLTTSLHGPLDQDQLITFEAGKDAAKKKFDDMAGVDGLVDSIEFQNGLAAKDGFLRGSENWQDALSFDTDGDQRLSLKEIWRYLSARYVSLADRFDQDGNGILAGQERRQANDWLSADLFELACKTKSQAIRPAQAVGIVNALLIAAILAFFHRIRRKEGQVFALLLILYPITRFFLEGIRTDTALHYGLTHNQYTSIITVLAGVVILAVVSRLPASAGPTWAERLALAGEVSQTKSSSHKNKRSKKRP